MKFEVKSRKNPNIPKYPSDDYHFADRFAKNMAKELGPFLKAAVLFGSTARKEKSQFGERDIDVLLIIDDLTTILNQETIQAYRVITENVAAKISKRLHITTLKTTTFWDYVRVGDPIAINMLRDGVALYDTGIFQPAQQLLYKGRIRPSKESIWTYFARAPNTLHNSSWHVLQATLDLYWAVVDAAHAAIMHKGIIPPTPSHLADLIEQHLVRKNLAKKKHAKTMAKFYTLQKKIIHRQIQYLSGKEYDKYREQAEEFVKAMQNVVEKH
ncbi:nucleotidyltransferase domain-containing protein [Candidatus Woesearchaeota archaeon]|nr:MAG: nucleotidyltransferase domain-containing protein [Candidatus Woesearchaeota archaeon]